MAKHNIASLFLLTRVAPIASNWSDEPGFDTHDGARDSTVPLGGFATEEAAEEARERLEREARETAPIGWFLRDLLPERMNDIADAARTAGLPPPDYSAVGPAPKARPVRGTSTSADRDYRDRVLQAVYAWWVVVSVDIAPQANAILWDHLLPNYTFYSVDRVPFE